MNDNATESNSLLRFAPISTKSIPALNPDALAALRAATTARIGLRHSGSSLATVEVLGFQLAHARARDAVHAALQPAGLTASLKELFSSNNPDILLLHSAASDRKTYLQRPDLGRRLSEPSRERLTRLTSANDKAGSPHKLAIVLIDGLSALAIERHAIPLLAELLPRLANECPALDVAPICIVEQGRVAVGDEIGGLLGVEMVVVLIGERPGLSSPDSLGVYITWQRSLIDPTTTITDADRNCISNIHSEGLSYTQAVTRLLFYIHAACSARQTGTALKDSDLNLKLNLNGTDPEPGKP